ncbi:MAG: DegV family protein [Acidimicrobiia bacterium]|nr:DegV family protein [Acidimicrobiia bacterium]MDH3426735.1 DegV family protein [Acidimicrobiia bacterium]MDH5615727.1 DegV family protein [Acidimicrobiia bacterium]
MNKVAVVTDSVAMLPEQLIRDLNIRVVPIVLNLDGRSYRDGIDLTTSEFYRLLATSGELPTTAAPSVGEFVRIFEEALTGAEAVVAIHVSSQLTSVYSSALLAADSVGGQVRVLDSQSATMAEGFVALAAARAARAAADLDAVVATAEEVRSKVRFFAFLETLEYLRRGGRVGGAAALMGNAIQLKPIIHVVDGQIAPLARPRTRRKATQAMLDIMSSEVAKQSVHAAVLHADRFDDAEDLRKRVENRFDCLELYVTELTPVMGTHTGPGLLGLAYYVE